MQKITYINFFVGERRKMDNKQKQLIELYEETVCKWNLQNGYSSPHLISLNTKNISTDIMFIGQETNEWYGSWSDFKKRSLVEQMSIYENFLNDLYIQTKSIFFKYVRELIANNNIVPVWTNLFKVDLGDSNKQKNISKLSSDELLNMRQLHEGLLAKEIEIIQPKIIIFFTGHNYDKLFIDPVILKQQDYKKLYKNIDALSVDEWKCCKLDLKSCEGFESFDGVAFRTYHPMYLNRTKQFSVKDIMDFLSQEITKITRK